MNKEKEIKELKERVAQLEQRLEIVATRSFSCIGYSKQFLPGPELQEIWDYLSGDASDTDGEFFHE